VRYIQTLGVLSKFNFYWPDINLRLLSWAEHFFFDPDVTFGITCYFGSSFALATICKLCLPLLILVLVPLGWAGNNALSHFVRPMRSSRRDELLGLYILVFVLFFQTLVKQMVAFLECIKMPNGSFVVGYRRDVLCWDDETWSLMFPIVVVVLTVMIVGSYAILWVVIYRNILYADTKTARRTKRRFIGQLADFRKGAFWWLMVINTKEVFFAITVVLFPADSYAQALWAGGWTLLYTLGTYAVRPFETSYNNSLELGLQCCLIAQILLGDLSSFDDRMEVGKRNNRITILLIVEGLGLLGVVGAVLIDFLQALRLILRLRGRSRRSEEEEQSVIGSESRCSTGWSSPKLRLPWGGSPTSHGDRTPRCNRGPSRGATSLGRLGSVGSVGSIGTRLLRPKESKAEELISLLATVQTISREAAKTFEVELCPSSEAPLGLIVRADRNVFTVKSVKPDGLLEEWNARNPDQHVSTGDRIIEVNGQSVDVEGFARELRQPGVLRLLVEHENYLVSVLGELDSILISSIVSDLRAVVAAATAYKSMVTIEQALFRVQRGLGTADIIAAWDAQRSDGSSEEKAGEWIQGGIVDLDELFGDELLDSNLSDRSPIARSVRSHRSNRSSRSVRSDGSAPLTPSPQGTASGRYVSRGRRNTHEGVALRRQQALLALRAALEAKAKKLPWNEGPARPGSILKASVLQGFAWDKEDGTLSLDAFRRGYRELLPRCGRSGEAEEIFTEVASGIGKDRISLGQLLWALMHHSVAPQQPPCLLGALKHAEADTAGRSRKKDASPPAFSRVMSSPAISPSERQQESMAVPSPARRPRCPVPRPTYDSESLSPTPRSPSPSPHEVVIITGTASSGAEDGTCKSPNPNCRFTL